MHNYVYFSATEQQKCIEDMKRILDLMATQRSEGIKDKSMNFVIMHCMYAFYAETRPTCTYSDGKSLLARYRGATKKRKETLP